MLSLETIEKLKISKQSCEAEARTAGETQAKEIINGEPDYGYLCTLNDSAKAWIKDGDADLTYIENIECYSSTLLWYLIDGFYRTIAAMHDKFRAAL
ncbi:MAG: hypothetical protein HXX11_15185 [Desulfuromonadales bacterium]|nr:hypothetical protein [Desulfuromonadales bacterium]